MKRLTVLMLVLLASTAISCQAPQEPGSTEARFRQEVADQMARAAEQAGISIDTDSMVIATRSDLLVANAPTVLDEGQEPFTTPMFVQIAGSACANVLAAGFYTVKTEVDYMREEPLEASFVNSEGEVAAVFPLEIEDRDARPGDTDQVGLTLRGFGASGSSAAPEAAAGGLIILGTCRCQLTRLFPPRWRHLHTVIV